MEGGWRLMEGVKDEACEHGKMGCLTDAFDE
jgi:hypothetical protein